MGKGTRVYLDISIGNRTGGRVIIELFSDVTPRTVENFRGLCTGDYGTGKNTKKKLCYEGCSIFRSSKGHVIQSGDIQFNNGDGGESIYGGSFNDEDFSRRHTQAGIVSMANKGRNSNTSQFFITLKRAPQLDNRHVVFGQVVDGMDVVRAVAQVPTDLDERPRVAIRIIGCGQIDRLAKRSGDDPRLQLSNQIAKMSEEAAKTKVNHAHKGKSILAGTPGGAQVDETGTGAAAAGEDEQELNESKVIDERKRLADPDWAKKQAEIRHKQAMDKEDGGKGSDADGGEGGKRKRQDSKKEFKAYMGDTIEHSEMVEAKKRKGNPDAFGWDVFNQESLMRAHDKRLKDIEFDEKAYKEQAEEIGKTGDVFSATGFGFSATEAAKDRLVAAMDRTAEKKKNFSRRRTFNPEEDCNFVNERNRVFNKKMERYFGDHTMETRQNLERGTAL
eukprot:TRINITY_DN36842_c0_g1_i4.p1 TRINITY_DN36842_c0_g1~~TRINITY_DN36842_c0_g1_i4.p1  ORF type:complete len:446 (-),score=109.81 TRINITY_DN36842_c0_g1_i4:173-1510(-)